MRCRDCDCAKRGYFKSIPDAYVCTGVKEPFVINNYQDAKCSEYKEKKNEILLTTLLLTLNSLKHSNLHKKYLLPILLPLTTSYYLCIRVFYIVTSIYQCYCYFAHLINKASKMYKFSI